MITASTLQQNARHLARVIAQNLYRYRWVWAVVTIALVGFCSRFSLALNLTESLPQRLFLIDRRDTSIVKDAYVAFRFPATTRPYGLIPEGLTAIKIIKGVAGDNVTHINSEGKTLLAINAKLLSPIKSVSRAGRSLIAASPGVIPEGFIFVYTPHPDSLDSRYAEPGLIELKRVIGRAYPLF